MWRRLRILNFLKIIVREKTTFSQTSDAITQPRTPRHGKGETAPWNLRVAKNIFHQTCVFSPLFTHFLRRYMAHLDSTKYTSTDHRNFFFFYNVGLYMQRHPANFFFYTDRPSETELNYWYLWELFARLIFTYQNLKALGEKIQLSSAYLLNSKFIGNEMVQMGMQCKWVLFSSEKTNTFWG